MVVTRANAMPYFSGFLNHFPIHTDKFYRQSFSMLCRSVRQSDSRVYLCVVIALRSSLTTVKQGNVCGYGACAAEGIMVGTPGAS